MSKLLYEFVNVETVEGGFRKVSSPPENWVVDGKLYWPPPKELNLKRKQQAPPEEGWTVYECKLLGESFATLKEALAKEKTYEHFSNSESEKEYNKRQQLKRKHPVTVDLIDANQLFDKVLATDKRSGHDAEICLDPILPAELLDGQYSREDTYLSVISEAFGIDSAVVVPEESSNNVESNQCLRSNEQTKQAIDRQTPLIRHTVQPSQYSVQFNCQPIHNIQPNHYNGQPSHYNGQPSHYNGQQSRFNGQPSRFNQPSHYNTPSCHYNVQPVQSNQDYGQSSQYHDQPSQHNAHENHNNVQLNQNSTQPKESYAYLNSQQSFQPIQFPARVHQYAFEAEDNAAHSSRNQDAANSGNERLIPITKGGKKGKENAFPAAKTVKSKAKTEKLKSGAQRPKKKNVRKSVSSSKKEVTSFRDSENIRSQQNPSPLAEYVSNYAPSPDQTLPDNRSQVEYLPIIYKELLEIKSICKANQVENNKNSEEIKKICEKLAATIEEDDPFADGSIETFNAQFPMKKKSKLKSFYQEMMNDSSIEKKLGFRFRSIGGAKPRVMIRECMKYFISDSLLKRYTWKGTTKKPGFAKFTRICKTLFSKVNGAFRKYTESKFSSYMSEYIKQANNRYTRKLKRQSAERDTDDDDDDKNPMENEEEGEENPTSGDDGSDEDDDEGGEDDDSNDDEDDCDE